MTLHGNDDPLARYGRARDGVVSALGELATLVAQTATGHETRVAGDELARIRDRLRDGRFVLAVVGEFSSGKSFLLNALLGKIAHEERAGQTRIVGLLATDINPSTATITELRYGTDEEATAFYPSGRTERIPLERLSRFIAVGDEAQLHDATDHDTQSPKLVQVTVNSPFLANGFVVADTPGLASVNPAHRRATLTYLPGADAVLYLVDTQQPFTQGDASFLAIVQRYIESIFIVQTKIDLWRMCDGERETWQSASARIIAQAAQHARDVPVFPLSAREFAQGQLSGDAALVAQSRFPEFRNALDASLVATTGRARLRRAAAQARRHATRAADTLTRTATALEHDAPHLRAMRAALLPACDAAEGVAHDVAQSLLGLGGELEATVVAAGQELQATLVRTLARAFDLADIAHLRDRAKLHIIVDETVATGAGRFATDVAEIIARRLRTQAQDAVERVVTAARSADLTGGAKVVLEAIAAEQLPLTEDAAAAFDADPSSGAWSSELEAGIRSTIVLGALGGPAVGLVSAIAGRFAAAAAGTYMKRELLADLKTDLSADFEAEIGTYVALNAGRVRTLYERLGQRIIELAARARGELLGVPDLALQAHAANSDRRASAVQARERAARVEALATDIETLSETFASTSRQPRSEHTHAAVPRDRVERASLHFDPETYEHSLRPERWRVAVLGALRRGKSSLINVLAGARLLGDEGSQTEMRFPVHVRYGPRLSAYALGQDAIWDAIELDEALEAATRTPVLIQTPWTLPAQLVLVHAPAFDSGLPEAEHIALAAARAASETLALFSRQLSDRELDLYARVCELGKPISFIHTLADNEGRSERRDVLLLAERYLRERGIVAQRLFMVSAVDYRKAREAGRQTAPWNEIGALQSTLEAHAREHMERLERLAQQRAAANQVRVEKSPEPDKRARSSSLFERIFRRH